MNNEDPGLYLVSVSPAKRDGEFPVGVTVRVSGKPDVLVPTTKVLPYKGFKETMGGVSSILNSQ
jgi:hypothetical protein